MDEHIADLGKNLSAIGYYINLTLHMGAVGNCDGGLQCALHSHCFSSVYHIRLSSLLPLA